MVCLCLGGTLIRGNHEDTAMNTQHGRKNVFFKQLQERCGVAAKEARRGIRRGRRGSRTVGASRYSVILIIQFTWLRSSSSLHCESQQESVCSEIVLPEGRLPSSQPGRCLAFENVRLPSEVFAAVASIYRLLPLAAVAVVGSEEYFIAHGGPPMTAAGKLLRRHQLEDLPTGTATWSEIDALPLPREVPGDSGQRWGEW